MPSPSPKVARARGEPRALIGPELFRVWLAMCTRAIAKNDVVVLEVRETRFNVQREPLAAHDQDSDIQMKPQQTYFNMLRLPLSLF